MTTAGTRIHRLIWVLMDKMLELGPVSRAKVRKKSLQSDTWYIDGKWLGSNYEVRLDWSEGRLLLDWGLSRSRIELTEIGWKVDDTTVKDLEDAADRVIEKMGQRP